MKTRLNCRLRPLNTALVLAGLLMAPGTAMSIDWDRGAGFLDFDWNHAGNWVGDVLPTGSDTVRLVQMSDRVILSGAGIAQVLEIRGAGAGVIVDTGGSLVVGDNITVGPNSFGGDAELTIQGGGTVSATSLSAGNGQEGLIRVTGAGSRLTVAPAGPALAQRFQVGTNGVGQLHIEDGANVTVNGTRTLHLGGVGIGRLIIGSGAGAGTLTADNVILGSAGSQVQFWHNGVTTFSAAISGNGRIFNTGTGTTILTGANTYSGGTTVTAGTLQGDTTSLQGNITNNAAVTFDQASAGTYAGSMSGTGALTKLGTGHLILTGTQTYTGATTVNAGTLSVNGSTASSAVTVNSGGILGGNGTLGNTTIASGGVLAPGNSIGTLTVNGSLNFAPGSIYRVEVDAAGANDRINATGTATLNGGTVDVQAGAGTYQASTQYTILNAAGGRTGTFAGVTSNLAFLTPTLGYDANNVFLTLARNDVSFASVAITPNQVATSAALQNAGNAGDMGTVQTALTGLSAAQARAAYDSASGAGIVALRRAGAGLATSFTNQLQARLGAQANAGNTASGFANSFTGRPVLLAANDHLSDLMAPVSDSVPQKFSLAGGASLPSSSPDAASKGLWIRGYGGDGNTHSDGNAAASRLRGSALSIGFDTQVRDGIRIGVAATDGTSRLSTDNNESGKTRGTALAVYGSYATGPWNFSGSASMGWGKNHLDRNVTVGGLNRLASSDFDSHTLSAYGEASHAIVMDGWTLQPLAGLSLSRNKADGFTETGAGALNLQVAEQTLNSSKVMLGAKASFDTGRIRFEPRIIWAHEFGDLNTPMTAQFQGAATASPFQVSGATLKRDTLILGLGASGSIDKGVDLFADVQTEHNSRQNNLAVLAGLRARW